MCSQDVVESDVAEVAWTFRHDREPPYSTVEIVRYVDGSSPCPRCGLRHPFEQMLRREGLTPPITPMGWGSTAAEAAEDDVPAPAGRVWPVQW